MERRVAERTLHFLDSVTITGHKQRMEMNTCVDALVKHANYVAPPPLDSDQPEAPDKPAGEAA